jgi:hypothetical protein
MLICSLIVSRFSSVFRRENAISFDSARFKIFPHVVLVEMLHVLMNPLSPAGKFPTMFQPSTEFSFSNTIQTDKNLPDMSPEAKISNQDQKELATLANRVLNGTLDYLIINVIGSGANLPVSNLLMYSVEQLTFDYQGIFIFTLNPVYTVLDPALYIFFTIR